MPRRRALATLPNIVSCSRLVLAAGFVATEATGTRVGVLGTAACFILIARDLATAMGFLVARAVPWLRRISFVARISGTVVTVPQLATLTSVLAVGDYTLALWRSRPS